MINHINHIFYIYFPVFNREPLTIGYTLAFDVQCISVVGGGGNLRSYRHKLFFEEKKCKRRWHKFWLLCKVEEM